jgi:hypothetical protein
MYISIHKVKVIRVDAPNKRESDTTGEPFYTRDITIETSGVNDTGEHKITLFADSLDELKITGE